MKTQCFNPYLPSWEYIPDGEPYVFDGRVYVFGSHDKFNGHVFCINDYVCWSAPVDDLSQWKYEGVIYKKEDDPLNKDKRACLYAPDVTIGPDGRFYLYYVLDKFPVVSVAVCDTPAGKYQFYGYVKYPDGTRYGEKPGDEPQFDPGVLTEGTKTYLYTGFCSDGDKSRTGAMGVTLDSDMLTVIDGPVIVVPGNCYGKGTGFDGHEYFEAASIRKHKDTYFFIYSSSPMHELCYATSKHPFKDFVYGGVIVSNCDDHIDTYKPPSLKTYPGGNNHGSIIQINDQWYVFYHRQTNGTWFSRQGCIEKIYIEDDFSIKQVQMTSSGANREPLKGEGEYPAFIACNLFNLEDNFTAKVTQDGRDGDEEVGYVSEISNNCVIGFKHFQCKNIKKVKVKTRGYCAGYYEVKTAFDGEVHGKINVKFSNIWTDFESEIEIPDGIQSLFFIYKGSGKGQLASFTLI